MPVTVHRINAIAHLGVKMKKPDLSIRFDAYNTRLQRIVEKWVRISKFYSEVPSRKRKKQKLVRCLRYHPSFEWTAVSNYSMLIKEINSCVVNDRMNLQLDILLIELDAEPPNTELGPKLVFAIASQIETVQFTIQIHHKVISDSYYPLHENIVVDFKKMKAEMRV
jgi:hypothetical protein